MILSKYSILVFAILFPFFLSALQVKIVYYYSIREQDKLYLYTTFLARALKKDNEENIKVDHFVPALISLFFIVTAPKI